MCTTLQEVRNAQSGECLRQGGEIMSALQHGRISEIFAGGLHEYLTAFLDSMQDLSREIQASFFAARAVETA